jgi:hypothetical protein
LSTIPDADPSKSDCAGPLGAPIARPWPSISAPPNRGRGATPATPRRARGAWIWKRACSTAARASGGDAKVYVDLQAARLQRRGLADENRFDTTLGIKPTDHWEVLAQTYAGQADHGAVRSHWLKTEFSVVRAFGDWSLQAGWRDTVAGRETARDRGVVLAVWRRL